MQLLVKPIALFVCDTKPKIYKLTLNRDRTLKLANSFMQMLLKSKNRMLCAEIIFYADYNEI